MGIAFKFQRELHSSNKESKWKCAHNELIQKLRRKLGRISRGDSLGKQICKAGIKGIKI